MNTIAAISTAIGVGGIGIVRMSGEKCFDILEIFFKSKKGVNIKNIKGYTIKYGYIVDEDNFVDEVLVSFFRAPNSYTAENLCEISSHGGTYIVKKILEICLKNGAQLAEPGEFTKRAFLNGRIDLSQAEAVIDIINSKTEKEAKSSIYQLNGGLSKYIKNIKEILMSFMVEIEVSIDYPEYDIEEVNIEKALNILSKVKYELEVLKKSFDNGKIIKDGINVALIGRPNVGKSSLLNAILKEERAIVTDIEGTTRDIIEESITVSGIPINIIDTAGIRKSNNKIEEIGIKKSREIAQRADLIMLLLDSTRTINKEEQEIIELIKNKKSIIILNKIDLNKININKKELEKNSKVIEISAKEGIGIEKIYKEIERLFNLNEINTDNSIVVTNIRHKTLLDEALKECCEALKTIKENMPIDIISISVKNIMQKLGEITGEEISSDIIKEIFSRFCLGK